MDLKEILSHVDHTLLSREATRQQIESTVLDGITFGTASVCIPPCFVRAASETVIKNKSSLPVCTVIGFPNGYNTSAVKLFELQQAISDGADELDMVINVADVKSGNFGAVATEIQTLRDACKGKILKVIIETCLLTQEEKIKLCDIVADCGADFIKTSTGFSNGGATREDISLIASVIKGRIGIKASGGIRTLKDAEDFINLGASRLGTSSLVKIAKQNL